MKSILRIKISLIYFNNNNLTMETLGAIQNFNPTEFQRDFKARMRKRSDALIELFLIIYFFAGIAIAFYYDTWLIAFVVRGSCLLAYFIAKKLFPNTNVYHYVASGMLGVFMAQFIYPARGLFEIDFFA